MKKPFPTLMRSVLHWLNDDRKLLYLTAALVIFGGMVRILNHRLSVWLLNSAFIPYFVMRFLFYFKNRRRRWMQVEKHRSIILAVLSGIVILNFFTAYRIEFLLLILLMIDYLFVVNERF
ncbi:MAG: hypothetical protein LBI89_04255 [Prevotellaceae bacterium]|jgi:hypothetical protein|nr:hypothetical protein [Prevotellaceae bacterium]